MKKTTTSRSGPEGKPKRASKAGPAGSAASRESAQKKRLRSQLQEAIARIDEEGLLFLLEQAQVLIHNAEVERINQEIQELHDRKAGPGAGAPAGSRPGTPARSPGSAGARPAVRVEEADNGKSFFLDFGGVRKVLALAEIKRLVTICYAADSKSAALRQLYTVLSRERGDILADAHIGGPSSPALDALFYAIREKYHLEDR
jgi:hypothetical protein